MEQRRERVYLETDRHRISGWITLARDGYRSRVSDVLNATEREFVPMTDCVVELIGREGQGTHHDVIAVSRHHIVLVIPEHEGSPALVPGTRGRIAFGLARALRLSDADPAKVRAAAERARKEYELLPPFQERRDAIDAFLAAGR